MPIKFLANHNCIIFGMSGAGKTRFILDVIKNKLVHPFPEKIYYMFSVSQKFMETWNSTETTQITFIKGLDFEQMDTSEPSMLVIDDLILSTNAQVAEMFILGSHHKRISIFYLTQSLFHNDNIYRTMSNNSHYMVLFYSLRNTRQLNTLARQIFAGKDLKRALNAYKRASENNRGFILFSFSPLLPQELAILTDYWSAYPSVYL